MVLGGSKRGLKAQPGQRGGERPYRVFISHSSRDAWIAKVMAEKVSALEIEVWLDVKDLTGGDVITQKILDGLDACRRRWC